MRRGYIDGCGGCVEVWRCGGCVEVWRCGGVEVWRCGGVGLKKNLSKVKGIHKAKKIEINFFHFAH